MPDFDVLVIGGGVAGLRAAIAARRAGVSVALLTKTHPLRTNSALNSGGLNAPLGGDDSPAAFAQDILMTGAGLCDPAVVRSFADEAAGEVYWLERMGAPFNRDQAGRIDRRPFGANRHNRTCYADDLTGHTVLQVVYEQFQREKITAFIEYFATALVLNEAGCAGVTALGLRAGSLELIGARAVLLATGGFTRMYAPSTASIGTTGDGQNLAYLSGARLIDMEMIQFHPTVFPGGPGLMLTEAALAEGGQIVDQAGQALVKSKFIPREKLSLEIRHALQNSAGTAMLDLRPIGADKLRTRFPQTCEIAREVAGIDVTRQPVPILPAAHRPIGGIETDVTGQTSLKGLFAVGECANNGLNGAGRLAGNTLTEALVFGRKVGEAAAAYARSAAKNPPPQSLLGDEERRLAAMIEPAAKSADSPLKLHAEMGKLMNERVGVLRDGASLQSALSQIQSLKERYARVRLANSSRIYNYELTSCLEVGAMLNLAELVTLAAEKRTESRGAHNRTDFPAPDDAKWSCHTIMSRADGAPRTETKPAAQPA